MPTKWTRALWLWIVEAMVALGIWTVSLEEIDSLSARIRVLQKGNQAAEGRFACSSATIWAVSIQIVRSSSGVW